MKKISLAVFMVVFAAGLFGFSGTSHAYYLEMTGVDGTLTSGEYYTMDIYFRGTSADNLETYFAAIEWNDSLVSFSGIQYYDYDRDNGTPMTFDDYNLWNGEELPDSPPGSSFGGYTIPDNQLWNINGAENLDRPDEFYPVVSGETLLAQLYFTADVTGYYTDIAGFIDSPQAELFMINEEVVFEDGLSIWKEGTSSYFGTSPVPVPAAVWLLGSGLLGLVGLRRRNR